MPTVVTYARDMLFTSKIREVARQLGITVTAMKDAAVLPEPEARLLILDLRLPESMSLLAAWKGSAPHRAVTVVGFIDHERTDVMDAARALGCEVMTKGQFSHALPRVLGATLDAKPDPG